MANIKRVPEPRGGTSWTAWVLAVGALIAIVLYARSSGVNQTSSSSSISGGNEIDAHCRANPDENRRGLQSWKDAGVIQSQSDEKIEVDEFRWEQTTHKAKVSMAIYFYCTVTHGNGGYITINGYHDGRKKAYMIDGNFFNG